MIDKSEFNSFRADGTSAEFVYNNRSELTTATVNGGAYAYDYDNIGNRLSSQSSAGAEADAAITEYTANQLNQYTALTVDGDVDFQPEYDADGNQTRVKTSTGIWTISYDAENRPKDFTSQAADGTITTVHCEYDYMGRRTTKMVTVGNNVTLQQRYLYRGYLQIACIDLTRSHHPALWYITWDPTQPIATRPLAIQLNGTWYTYGWDLTKNICELYGQHGYIRTAYTYAPYGQVSEEGDVTQPIQWSSEFNDTELGLIYYNYRHYNPVDGRWTGRDSLDEPDNLQYVYVENSLVCYSDVLGQKISLCFAYDKGKVVGIDTGKRDDAEKRFATGEHKVFSGRGEDKNNPDSQHIANYGPVPIGEYRIGKREPHRLINNSGEWRWYPLKHISGGLESTYITMLTPDGGMVTRGDFYIHAGSVSEGCVTFLSDVCKGDPMYPTSKEYSNLMNFIEKSSTKIDERYLYVRATQSECDGVMEAERNRIMLQKRKRAVESQNTKRKIKKRRR